MTKSENSTTTGNSSLKTSINTTKTTDKAQQIHQWYSDLILFLDSEELKYTKDLLNNCTIYNTEANLKNKSELKKLDKAGIAYSFTFRFVERAFKNLKEDILNLRYHKSRKVKCIKRVDIKKENTEYINSSFIDYLKINGIRFNHSILVLDNYSKTLLNAAKLSPNLGDKTFKCIFLGYSSYSPGYQVLDITSKSIVIICDEYFNEKQPLQHQFSQFIYHNEFEMNKNKQNKINLEDNTFLMDEYSNENMLDNN
ncbi:hypothetical protein H8356DRAFT_1349867 [Neocallimastix lanati (nom. inval.)]|nr:hypothetical protein H8356DRAFT_1349867 [Neocallimastix sp. JGI-2020a]